MLYSLTEGETKIEIVAFVLDIIDHKDYDMLFSEMQLIVDARIRFSNNHKKK